jgi:sirohydrochlorin cobaltochelatase
VKTAVIILGHGSRSKGADETVKRVVVEVKKIGGYEIVEHAFLQYVRPAPHDAMEKCVQQQAEKIVIVPFFMQSGAHVSRDIPELVEKAKKQYSNIDIVVTDCVGAHPLMAKIVTDLIGKAK